MDADKEYKLVTIKMNHNGVVLRGLKKGGDIKSKMYEVKQGDFILSGIDARNGAFGIVPAELDGAIVTNDFWYFQIDEAIINKALFLELTSTAWFDEICKRGSDGTTQRIRLQKDNFFNQEIYLPLSDSQQALLTKIQSIKSKQTALHQQAIEQQKQVKQLRQAILQEAIQGKLTEDWRAENPDIEPARELLKRIKAEKQKLVDEKKFRKEKPLPPITDEEMPFELPSNWVWRRPQDICTHIIDCPHSTPKFIDEGMNCIDSTCINIQGDLLKHKIRKVSLDSFNERNKRLIPKPGDIVYVREGVIGQAIIVSDNQDICLGQRVMLYRLSKEVIPSLFRYIITSRFYLNCIAKIHKGMGAKHVNMQDLRMIPIPLPPYKEQVVILKKIESLMQKYTALEFAVKRSKAYAEQLIQSIIKEAFEPNMHKEIS